MRVAAALACLTLAACGSPRAGTSARLEETSEGEASAAVMATPAEEVVRAIPEPAIEASPAMAPTPAIRVSLAHEAAIDEAVHAAIARGDVPGAVVVVGRADGVVFRRAYGRRAIDPAPRPMRPDTIFDLASITKAVATTSAVMLLVQRGELDLDAPIARYLPELRAARRVTARHLLTHTAGLPSVNPLRDYEVSREEALARIFALPLEAPPGARVRYSDLGFIVLGELVARVSGRPLDAFVREAIFAPLGMAHTRFTPPAEWRDRIAPTERAARRGDVLIHGEVHDPRAWRLGGVAGHAGLFASADDLSRFARALLRGEGPLAPATVATMTAPRDVAGQPRALGWDLDRPGMSARAFGHGGYTGTSISIDPEHDVFVILLSNRVHPHGEGSTRALVRALGPLAVEAARDAAPPPEAVILPGVDVLERDGFRALEGARVALLTHAAARARDGRRTLDVLHAAEEVELVRLLAPEHGLGADREGAIADAREPRTGLPVHGLFGRTRAPTDAMLEGIDTLVIDLEAVGVRFYTYAATVRRVLEAAAARGLRVVILDRPEPLGGLDPIGPVSEPALESFVNHHPLPAVHGMTLGELASLLNEERGIGARLDVIEVEGWRRGTRAEGTGLRWVPPSPNLRTPVSVALYPAVGLLEGTNVSVGRGTARPFEQIGAPWIDGRALAEAIGAQPGVVIAPTSFVPTASRHRRARCEGVRLTLVDASRLRPVRLGLAIAQALARLYPDAWDGAAMQGLVGHRAVHAALLRGDPIEAIERRWSAELARFAAVRARYLRYRAAR